MGEWRSAPWSSSQFITGLTYKDKIAHTHSYLRAFLGPRVTCPICLWGMEGRQSTLSVPNLSIKPRNFRDSHFARSNRVYVIPSPHPPHLSRTTMTPLQLLNFIDLLHDNLLICATWWTLPIKSAHRMQFTIGTMYKKLHPFDIHYLTISKPFLVLGQFFLGLVNTKFSRILHYIFCKYILCALKWKQAPSNCSFQVH